MSSQNDQTLRVYAKHADSYERDTLADFNSNPEKAEKIRKGHQAFLSKSLQTISKDGKLFEVGSGYGRDAIFIRSLGYSIQVSDAVDSFIERLKQEDFEPVKFNLITDDFTDKYDYILANAVLVHFPKDEVEKSIRKIYDTLNLNGVFAFSLKQRAGGGEDYKTDIAGERRYFSYWDIGEIERVAKKVGFKIISVEQIGGIRACWLDVIVKKEVE
jgi:SAM-dependent methyltransferase